MYPPEFQLLRLYLADIPRINWGGCGIAALAMYMVGRKLGMDIHIMYLYEGCDNEEFKANTLALVYPEEIGMNCTHAVCVVGNKAIDCRNDDIHTFLYDYKHFLPEHVVRKTLNGKGWNSEFNRAKYIPQIEQFIGQKLDI